MILNFRLSFFICDAPASEFLKQIVGHTEKQCECYEIVGEYVVNCIVLLVVVIYYFYYLFYHVLSSFFITYYCYCLLTLILVIYYSFELFLFDIIVYVFYLKML